MKVCDRCYSQDLKIKVTGVLIGAREDAALKREWDLCTNCVKELAAWISKGVKKGESK